MGTRQIAILRELDADQIERLRKQDEFFWIDLDLAGEVTVERIAEVFGIDEGAAETLGNFARATSPAHKMHVDGDLIVFRYWCIGLPDAEVPGGIEAIEPFQVNVLLHGDYLLTVHRQPYDVPGEVTEGRIPPGRSERYAVYLAIDGMTNTVLETMSNIEQAVGNLETDLLQTGLRPRTQEKNDIASLRDRLTGLRMRIGPQRALFERVGEEIDQIEGLEGDRGAYFDRIQQQLDRAVDRIDAASEALSHALEIQLNETTYRLTIIATIFLPLGFIVGFFGMNFSWMTQRLESEADFLIFGIAIWLVPLLAIAIAIRGRDAIKRRRRA
jgi:magnesium transporter